MHSVKIWASFLTYFKECFLFLPNMMIWSLGTLWSCFTAAALGSTPKSFSGETNIKLSSYYDVPMYGFCRYSSLVPSLKSFFIFFQFKGFFGFEKLRRQRNNERKLPIESCAQKTKIRRPSTMSILTKLSIFQQYFFQHRHDGFD